MCGGGGNGRRQVNEIFPFHKMSVLKKLYVRPPKPNSWLYNFVLGKISRVLRLKVSVYNMFITNQFQTTTFALEGRGVKLGVEVTVISKEKNS